MSTDQHDQSNGEPRTYPDDLVAYLDGELDAASTDHIENLLSSNPAMRTELRRLEQTWDLLDELPRAAVDQSFSTSTSQMIALAAEQELEEKKAAIPRQQRERWIWTLGGIAAALLCGFLGVRWLLPDPNAVLLADLPILENLDAYRQAGSVEFLRMLSTDRPFPVSEGDSAAITPVSTATAETPLARRDRVEHMTPQEKDQLGRKAERFFELPLDEQRQLRELHAAIQQHPQRDELYRVMFAYYDWLKTLTSGEPTDLHQLGPEERLAKIKQVEGKRLTNEDRQAVETWARDLAKARRIEFRVFERGPPRDGGPPREGPPRDGPDGRDGPRPGGPGPGGPGGPRGPGRPDDEHSPRYVLFGLANALANKGNSPLTKQEIDALAQQLSAPRKDYLASLPIAEQRNQAHEWIRAVAWRPYSRPNLTEDQTRTLLKDMPADRREQLLKRSPQDMQRHLREIFYGGGGDRFGPPPGMGRDGPRGGPGFRPEGRGDE